MCYNCLISPFYLTLLSILFNLYKFLLNLENTFFKFVFRHKYLIKDFLIINNFLKFFFEMSIKLTTGIISVSGLMFYFYLT